MLYNSSPPSATSERSEGPARVESIPLDRIKDGGAQMRVEMRPETVNDYAADMLDGAVFPPVIVFDDGTDLWLADGFHRVEAARKIERRDDHRRDQAGLGARRDPAWRRLQCGAWPASHPGGQAARGRAAAERPRMGALVRPQDRRGRQGRSQDGRARSAGSWVGNSPPPPTTKANEWGIPHRARQAKRPGLPGRRRSSHHPG